MAEKKKVGVFLNLRFKFRIFDFCSENVFFGVVHRYLFIIETVSKKVFGMFEAVSYLGSFLALAGGISVLSLLQLLLDFLRLVIPSKISDTEFRGIPALTTRNKFHVLSEKLNHLKKHATEYAGMSSIHGIRNITEGFRKKIFWLAVISVATASCVHFVRNLFDASYQNEVIMEFDDQVWSTDEVCLFDKVNFLL